MYNLVERMKLCIFCLSFICVMLISPNTNAEEFRIDRFFVIGDSLSDAGTYSQAIIAGGAPGGINYRFLNNRLDGTSKTWAEFLGDELGLQTGPDILSGIPGLIAQVDVNGGNYAEGGARVSQQPGIGFSPATGITTTPASVQVDRLLADVGGRFTKNDLVAVWAGANDGFAQFAAFGGSFITLQQANLGMASAANDLATQIDRLNAAGAKNIIVITIPDYALTPFGASQSPAGTAVLSGLAASFNNQLKSNLRGKNAVIVDSTKLLTAITNDPLKYGFTAPGAAVVPLCLNANSITCIDGLTTRTDGTYIYADGVHPTVEAHRLFAQAGFAGLQAASQNGTIGIATLTALRQQSVSIENRLNMTAFVQTDQAGKTVRRKVGHIDKYGSIEGGYYSADQEQVSPGLEATTEVVKLGADVMVAPNALVGMGISVDHGQVDFNDDAGGFDSRLFVGALFTNIALSKSTYINAVLSAGYIDVYNINRAFDLGPARESYNAETSGLYKMARVGGGFNLPYGNWLITPSASLTYEIVEIDGYTESDGAASLSFGDNEYESVRVSAGVTIYYKPQDPNGWTPMLRASLEHELNNDDEYIIQMGPDSETLGKVTAPRPDGTFGYVTLGLSKNISQSTTFGISATTVLDKEGQQGITGSLTLKSRF